MQIFLLKCEYNNNYYSLKKCIFVLRLLCRNPQFKKTGVDLKSHEIG